MATPSYPSAIWSPSSITSATQLSAALATDAAAEIDAIEAELGINIQGTAGSLRDRLNMFMDDNGQVPYYKILDASTSERKSLRAGTTVVETDDLTDVGTGGRITITFAQGDVPAMTKSAHAFVEIQTLAADLSDPTEPAIACFEFGSGTTTTFDILVCDGYGKIPAAGTSFILHWIVVESSFHSTSAF